jgi:CDP-paratose 2-epimerase
LIDCAAEPSVQAGLTGGPLPVINANLVGTVNSLEAARIRHAAFLLLSTSRVYPLAALNGLRYRETATRFEWEPDQAILGFSASGVSEQFPLDGPRSLYGATKLAGELLLQEYVYNYGLPALINRCGVLAGPWQMGRVDQGVVALWIARHFFQQPLKYIGFEGTGKQVRDVLHIEDLFDLIVAQCQSPAAWNGSVFNVGGGRPVSVSLAELTACCQTVTGRCVEITPVPETHAVDLRIYLTDADKARGVFGWTPRRNVETIVRDTHAWIAAQPDLVASVFL